MIFQRISDKSYISKNGIFHIIRSNEGFWYYRFKGFVKGKILVSFSTYQDYKSVEQFLQRSLIHNMKELETGKNFKVIIKKEALLNNYFEMEDWVVSINGKS